MTVSAKQMKSRLTPAERKAVEKRAAALISEEMRLRELRASLALTQERLAERMKVGQETVSRIEFAELGHACIQYSQVRRWAWR